MKHEVISSIAGALYVLVQVQLLEHLLVLLSLIFYHFNTLLCDILYSPEKEGQRLVMIALVNMAISLLFALFSSLMFVFLIKDCILRQLHKLEVINKVLLRSETISLTLLFLLSHQLYNNNSLLITNYYFKWHRSMYT